MTRRLAVAFAVALLASLALASAASAAASASSWRATIYGAHVHGGATLLLGDGRGTISLKLTGATPGQSVAVSLTTAPCPSTGRTLVSFLAPTSPAGIAVGKALVTSSQAKAINAAISARTRLAIVAVTPGDTGCGDLVGAPRVGTERLQGAEAGVFTYDIRFPSVSGIDAVAAARVNAVLRGDAEQKAASYVVDARKAFAEFGAEDAEQHATQTFLVTLARPNVLSLVESWTPNLITAFEGDESFPTFTFDLVTGRRLTLADLFRPGSNYLEALSRETESRLIARWGKLTGQFTNPTAENFASWNLTSTGIHFVFNQLSTVGITASVTIPWTALLDVANRNGTIAGLLPHPVEIGGGS